MLNTSGKKGHPCLIPDFRGNGFSFFPINMMLAICLSYRFVLHSLYYVEVHSFISSFIRAFIMKWC
jgi:hypothetical protein